MRKYHTAFSQGEFDIIVPGALFFHQANAVFGVRMNDIVLEHVHAADVVKRAKHDQVGWVVIDANAGRMDLLQKAEQIGRRFRAGFRGKDAALAVCIRSKVTNSLNTHLPLGSRLVLRQGPDMSRDDLDAQFDGQVDEFFGTRDQLFVLLGIREPLAQVSAQRADL